ncbi:SDR family NAD(P)-dependent oxidoreductase [Bordetella genomosp. 13]|uniref:SDR family NAD(P)-dependent oxidoreductase n=1 Tax=Bordetella genomosp. 13 TaxID=463040 RepID=UPI00119CFFDC|nr:SDR family oxidoreductase [Bordetella genomosp. 13]
MFSLNGKSIFITGATGHLGRQLALSLGEMGAHVIVNSRTQANCESLALDIEKAGGAATAASFDVTDVEQIKKFAESIDSLDVLVNNSYAGAGGTVEISEGADYASSYQSSVIACANLVRYLLPHLRKAVIRNGYASVINVASMYGMVSPDPRIYDSAAGTNPPFYGAAKAALIQWTKYAACEFAKEKIRVNCVSPGPFPSLAAQANNPELMGRIVAKVPMNRIGQPLDLVGPVAFLASPSASFVTGVNIPVDGGWTSW